MQGSTVRARTRTGAGVPQVEPLTGTPLVRRGTQERVSHIPAPRISPVRGRYAGHDATAHPFSPTTIAGLPRDRSTGAERIVPAVMSTASVRSQTMRIDRLGCTLQGTRMGVGHTGRTLGAVCPGGRRLSYPGRHTPEGRFEAEGMTPSGIAVRHLAWLRWSLPV